MTSFDAIVAAGPWPASRDDQRFETVLLPEFATQMLTPSKATPVGFPPTGTDLTNRAQGFMQQLEIVEDAARKADVLPGRVREVFDRHRLR